jgi:putative transposase
MWLFTFSLTLAQKHLKIPTRYNCKYQQKDILRALTYLSLQNTYANSGLRQLTKKLQRYQTHKNNKHQKTKKKQQKNKTHPNKLDSDTFLYRLNQLNRHTTKTMLNNLNQDVLKKAKQKGAFTKKVTLAIDLTCIPYYGKITHWVNGGKPKQGTSYFHTWATLRIVSAGRRFTIKALPIKRGCLDAETMAKTLKQLLNQAKTLNLKVDLVLLDKGFCWQQILQELNTSGYKYLVALKKDKQVKAVILDYFTTKKGRVRRFSKGVGDNRVRFNVTIHRFKKCRRRKPIKNILELYGAFATNLGFSEAVRVWSRIPDFYRRRWGIETGYRVDGGFRALTTSRDEKLRFVYFEYMVFLENLWVLYNLGEAMRGGVGFVDGHRFWVTGRDFCEDFVYLLVVVAFDRGPPWFWF